jgi:hypothetical protein
VAQVSILSSCYWFVASSNPFIASPVPFAQFSRTSINLDYLNDLQVLPAFLAWKSCKKRGNTVGACATKTKFHRTVHFFAHLTP